MYNESLFDNEKYVSTHSINKNFENFLRVRNVYLAIS